MRLIKFIALSIILGKGDSSNFQSFSKCCEAGSFFNDKFECTKTSEKTESNKIFYQENINQSGSVLSRCFEGSGVVEMLTEETREDEKNATCVDTLTNGTRVKLFCNWKKNVPEVTPSGCDSLFTQLHFWGATIVVFATIIYNVPFIIVVIIYCSLPELRFRAYDKAVVNYNLCYALINFLLTFLGLLNLCHCTISITTYRLFGLFIMFWTQGAVIWLFIICFDMTLVITRFRWAPKGGSERSQEERKKGLIYSAWGWGFAAIFTLIAATVELTPIFPENSIIRPNFHKFDKTNIAVIVYVITGPILICFANTCLFVYTTMKTIKVQKSTAVVQENRKNNVKKKYFIFLKLYLLMDTPWLTGALGAIYPDLWILKFIKMIQPILIIVLLVPRKRIFGAITCCKGEVDSRETVGLNKEEGNKDDRSITKKAQNNIPGLA